MQELIDEIRTASQSGLYVLALHGALSVPDICGALESDNGRATGAKYKAWLRGHVPEQAHAADVIYGLRCSLLHQGKAMPHGGHFPIAFTPPNGAPQVHNVSMTIGSDRVDWMSIPLFVDEVTRGAEAWFARFGSTTRVQRNMENYARFRPEGLPPFVVGVPVFA